jgi:hypothetical protein
MSIEFPGRSKYGGWAVDIKGYSLSKSKRLTGTVIPEPIMLKITTFCPLVLEEYTSQ